MNIMLTVRGVDFYGTLEAYVIKMTTKWKCRVKLIITVSKIPINYLLDAQVL